MTDGDATTARNADRTRMRIIEAAQLAFTEKGFDAAGTREIATRAGVNIALISRYFGSKEGLFEAAVLSALSLDDLLALPRRALAGAIVDLLAEKDLGAGVDPVVAILRSVSSPVVGVVISAAIEARAVAPLAARLGGPDARQRAATILALIAGYDVSARMLKLDLGADTDPAGLRVRLAGLIGPLVDA